MASSRTRDAVKKEVKLELTPMIDVTFLILIFFMCTLKFKTLDAKFVSYLPTDRGLGTPMVDSFEMEDAELILKVPEADWDKEPMARRVIFKRNGTNKPFGTAWVGKERGPGGEAKLRFDPPETLARIQDYLKVIRDHNFEAKAKINAFPRCPHVFVINTLDLLVGAGYKSISYTGISPTLVRDLEAMTLNGR